MESRNGLGRRNFDCINMVNISLVVLDVKIVNKVFSCFFLVEKFVKIV